MGMIAIDTKETLDLQPLFSLLSRESVVGGSLEKGLLVVGAVVDSTEVFSKAVYVVVVDATVDCNVVMITAVVVFALVESAVVGATVVETTLSVCSVLAGASEVVASALDTSVV